MERSLSHYGINPLYRYLSKVFGEQETERLMKMYHVGTSYKWGGSTIYWQVDKDDKVRTGKVMLYNPKDGHRVKEPRSYVGWAHTFLHLPDFNLCQCFFGEHLLAQHPTMSVAIVESEKTAIIASHFISNFIWLATGGFGTLDSETLDTALDALDALNASGKTIGVISHVEAMKERIPVQIKVKKINGLGYSKLESAFAMK